MAETNVYQSTLLASIIANPAAALDKQKNISSEATCSLLRESRRMLGILNKSDEIELTLQFISAMRFIADHDYLYYLSLIGRFDLIREIFWDKENFASQMLLIEEMEKAQAHQKLQQEILLDQDRMSAKLKVNGASTTDDKYSLEVSKMLANMDVYHYLELEQQRIYKNYYNKQSVVYTEAFEGRISRIRQTVTIAADMPDISNEDKESLNVLLTNYEKEFNTVKNIPTVNGRGALDYKSIDKKLDEWKRIDAKYSQLLTTFLEKHQDKKEFSDLLKQERTATQIHLDAVLANEIERDQELEQLTPHLEASRETVKADLAHHMHETLELLKECDLGQMPEEHKLAFKMSLHTMREQLVALNRASGDLDVHDISSKFATEIAKIKPMVKPPVLAQSEFEKFNKAVVLFSKIDNLFKSETIHSPMSKTSVMPHPPADDGLSSPPPYENSLNESSDILIEKFQRSRDEVRFFRAERTNGASRPMEVDQEAPIMIQEEGVILDDDNKDLLRSNLLEIIQKLNELKNAPEVNPKTMALIVETQNLCKGIKSQINGELLPSQMNLLSKNIQSLIEHAEELDENLLMLDNLLDSIEKSPRSSI